MGYLIAAAAIAAGGAYMSYSGASANAEAQQEAAMQGIAQEKKFYDKWSGKAEEFNQEKLDKLYNQSDVFERFDAAAFDKETYDNLRKAQSDYAKLAAGDFSGFESQLRKSMSDALVSTVGAGSPIGAYAGLAADTLMGMRQQGLSNATNLSQYFSTEGNRLLGLEFGVMDQGFDMQYQLDRTKTTNINNLNTQQASYTGVDQLAAGSGLQSIAAAMMSYGTYSQNQQVIDNNQQYQSGQLALMQQQYASRQPQQGYYSASQRPTFNYAQPTGFIPPVGQNVVDQATLNLPSGNSVVNDGMVLPQRQTSFNPYEYEMQNTGSALYSRYLVDTEPRPFYSPQKSTSLPYL